MNIYVNGFRCAMSNDNSSNNEFILDFIQRSPTFDERGEIVGEKSENVASIVMSKTSAKALSDMIALQFNDDEDEDVK